MSGEPQEPVGGQAYDNAVYRMNHPEYEDNDATFYGLLVEELGSTS